MLEASQSESTSYVVFMDADMAGKVSPVVLPTIGTVSGFNCLGYLSVSTPASSRMITHMQPCGR